MRPEEGHLRTRGYDLQIASLRRRRLLNAIVRNPWDEYALCLLFRRRRMRLPDLALEAWFPEADDTPVSISAIPKQSVRCLR